jgi:Methyltransferase domain
LDFVKNLAFAGCCFNMGRMSAYLFLKGHLRQPVWAAVKQWHLRGAVSGNLDRPTWEESLRDPTAFYRECQRYFYQRTPPAVREHRAYFQRPWMGFGEDAFHAMWFLLFREFKPAAFLEIGVYRGQTLSLAALLSRINGVPCEVQGISPFSSAGDSLTKRYSGKFDYYEDTLKNFEHFKLPVPKLLRAYSTDDAAKTLITSRRWDLIYIDGNHDYEVARQDWTVCAAAVKPGGAIVLDDAGLTTSYRPPIYASPGHPGPSRLAVEVGAKGFREILQVGHNRVFQRLG